MRWAFNDLTPGVATRRVCRRSWRLVCHHPERMRSLSPGLRGKSYPGWAAGLRLNPEGVASSIPPKWVNPTVWREERTGRAGDTTLTGLAGLSRFEPRVARASQPWAERYNPFGIARNAQTPLHRYAMGTSDFGLRTSFGLRPSAFGLRPSFGPRPSDFGLPPA